MKIAARWGTKGVRYFSGEQLYTAAVFRMGFGDRGHEGFSIWMLWRLEDLYRRGNLNDFSDVHYSDPITDVFDDTEIMGDKEISQRKLILEVSKKIEALGLYRYIQR